MTWYFFSNGKTRLVTHTCIINVYMVLYSHYRLHDFFSQRNTIHHFSTCYTQMLLPTYVWFSSPINGYFFFPKKKHVIFSILVTHTYHYRCLYHTVLTYMVIYLSPKVKTRLHFHTCNTHMPLSTYIWYCPPVWRYVIYFSQRKNTTSFPYLLYTHGIINVYMVQCPQKWRHVLFLQKEKYDIISILIEHILYNSCMARTFNKWRHALNFPSKNGQLTSFTFWWYRSFITFGNKKNCRLHKNHLLLICCFVPSIGAICTPFSLRPVFSIVAYYIMEFLTYLIEVLIFCYDIEY